MERSCEKLAIHQTLVGRIGCYARKKAGVIPGAIGRAGGTIWRNRCGDPAPSWPEWTVGSGNAQAAEEPSRTSPIGFGSA
jgi:hypothetical protein